MSNHSAPRSVPRAKERRKVDEGLARTPDAQGPSALSAGHGNILPFGSSPSRAKDEQQPRGSSSGHSKRGGGGDKRHSSLDAHQQQRGSPTPVAGTPPYRGVVPPKGTPPGARRGRRNGAGPSTPFTPPAAGRAAPSSSSRSSPFAADGASRTPSSSRRGGSGSKPRFRDHLPQHSLQQGLKSGHLFRGVFRVNAGNRNEAYVTLADVPYDIFVKGAFSQNRAVDGDEVALAVQPPACWYRQHSPPRLTIAEQPPQQPPQQPLPLGDPAASSGAGDQVPQQGVLSWQLRQQKASEQHGEGMDRKPSAAAAAAASAAAALQGPSPACLSGSQRAAGPGAAAAVEGAQQSLSLLNAVLDRLREDPVDVQLDARMAGLALDGYTGSMGSSGSLPRSSSGLSQPFGNCPAGGGNVTPGAASKQPQPQPWYESCCPSEGLAAINRAIKTNAGARPTGEVMAVLEPSRRRDCVVGVAKEDGGGGALFLIPSDPRLPKCILRSSELPPDLKAEIKQQAPQADGQNRTLLSAVITGWDRCNQFPAARVRASLGQAAELEGETRAILADQQVRDEEFKPEVLDCLPPAGWAVGPSDLAVRKDLRATRLFTIDPPTAKDLDDALSVQRLPNGLLRLGVHIADVSHFVQPGTALDEEASQRATSTYLVQRVIPMLPPRLCEELCSLNPGQERLAYSIMWDMNAEDGNVVHQWAGRTVIASCAKLAYPQAQAMIESRFDAEHDGAQVQLHGGHAWEEVVSDVLDLHHVATALRERRFAAGALALDSPKPYFELDDEGNPGAVGLYERCEAHWLVEEMMLAANIAAADIIARAYPERALLRHHPPPASAKMQEVAEVLEHAGLPFDHSSSGAMAASFDLLEERHGEQVAETARQMVLRGMQLARYFCTSKLQEDQWRHYGLAVERYTHFTSPIRRYPDVLVHRLLTAALEGGSESGARQHGLLEPDDLQRVAEVCNQRKYAAKAAQEASLMLHMCCMLARQPRVALAVVLRAAGPKFVDLYVPELGVEQRVYVERIGPSPTDVRSRWEKDARVLTLELAAGPRCQTDREGSNDTATTSGGGRINGSGSIVNGSSIDHATSGSGGSGNGGGGSVKSGMAFDPLHGVESASALANPRGLRPVALPLQLHTFETVPVVVAALKSAVSGRWVDVMIRPYLDL